MTTREGGGPGRPGTRRALVTGLGVVLALLLALGLYAARSLSNVSRAGTLTTREYFQQSERLERVHSLLSSAAGAVRDYLLDADAAALARHREAARRSWAEALRAMGDYKDVAAPGRRSLTGQLDAQISDYWVVASRSLDLTGRQRSEAAAGLLIGQLVPLREKVLATLGEIGVRDRTDLRASAARTATFVREAELRLWGAIGVIVLLSLLVAGTTVRYLLRLESIAQAQYEATVKAGAELEALSRRLLTLQEDERRNIARELHDDFGQRMAGLLFELSAAAERAERAPDLKVAIQSVRERLGSVAKDLQQLSRSLHSAVLDKIGLEAAIRADCSALEQRTGWEIDFRSAGVPKRLPEPVSLAAYRTFQEALQNALKHSQTRRLKVGLTAENGSLVLQISDYGQGFDIEAANHAGSLGLVSMRERLRMVGGVFSVRSEIGKGTRVEARLPVANP